MTLQPCSPTGTTDMDALNKRSKTCLILFWIALSIAILAFAGAILLAFYKTYPPAFVLTALSLVGFYSAPIYYNNAALAKASAKISAAITEGADSFEKISEKTGIRIDVCKKLYSKAVARGMIKENNKLK